MAPRAQPLMTRPGYSRELVHAMTFPVALSLVEGSVIGVLATKAFAVSAAQFSTIMAAPMFANVTSFGWAYLARGRRKIAAINAMQAALLVSVALIALLPTSGHGPALLTALIVLNRCLQSGIITIRSVVWRHNYPRQVRARITGKLALINSLIMAFVPLAGYALMDSDERAFRVVYPLGAAIGFIGVWAFSRIRMRRERELLRYERSAAARPQPHGEAGAIYEFDPDASAATVWSVLKQDRLFRAYQGYQFILGIVSMAAEVVAVYVIASLTRGMHREYMTSIALTMLLPMILTTVTLPVWARGLDRTHVVRFRVRGGWFWFVAHVFLYLGAAMGSLWVLAVSRVFVGIGRAAGVLAWNLGHNDFADRRMVALYMGIHVTLTGVRGIIGPFVGMALYTGWVARGPLPAFDGIGHHLFLISCVGVLIAQAGFVSLFKQIPQASAK